MIQVLGLHYRELGWVEVLLCFDRCGDALVPASAVQLGVVGRAILWKSQRLRRFVL